jgi:hypothetical protein
MSPRPRFVSVSGLAKTMRRCRCSPANASDQTLQSGVNNYDQRDAAKPDFTQRQPIAGRHEIESDPPIMTVIGHNRVCCGPERTLDRDLILRPSHEMRFLQHHMDTFGAVHYLGYSQVGRQAT